AIRPPRWGLAARAAGAARVSDRTGGSRSPDGDGGGAGRGQPEFCGRPPGVEPAHRPVPLPHAASMVRGRVMASWARFAAEAPALAARVHERFGTRKHKTLATLRKDGSPRISGIEVEFADGEIFLGMMPGSRKLHDLERDPRLALHSPTEDPPPDDPRGWPGEAKIAGHAVAGDHSSSSHGIRRKGWCDSNGADVAADLLNQVFN